VTDELHDPGGPPFDEGTTQPNGAGRPRSVNVLPPDMSKGDVFGRADRPVVGGGASASIPQPLVLRTLDDVIGPAIDRAERRAQGIERPVPIPWPMLAGHFGGGFWPGVHYLVSGTGIGKTALALQCAIYAARDGIPVLYVGLELEELQIALRVIGEASGVPWSALYTGHAGPALIERARAAMPKVRGLPLHVELARPQGWPSSDLPRFVDAMRALYPEPDGPGSRPFLVVIDFLQIVGEELDANGRSVELRERIGRAAYRCRDVASRLGASVVVVSSAARDKYGQLGTVAESADLKWDTDDNGRPVRRRVLKPDVLVGLGKESGEIEYSADSVSVLARVPNSDDGDGGCDVLFVTAKGRATGATWSPLHFTGHGYREADDGGSFVVATLKEAADERGAKREAKVRAKEDAKVAKIVSDAVAVARYVLAHPRCVVSEARVHAVADTSRRWTPAVAKLGAALVQTPNGKRSLLTVDRDKLPADVLAVVNADANRGHGHSPPVPPPPSTSTVDGPGPTVDLGQLGLPTVSTVSTEEGSP
jgi:hypothetical protein